MKKFLISFWINKLSNKQIECMLVVAPLKLQTSIWYCSSSAHTHIADAFIVYSSYFIVYIYIQSSNAAVLLFCLNILKIFLIIKPSEQTANWTKKKCWQSIKTIKQRQISFDRSERIRWNVNENMNRNAKRRKTTATAGNSQPTTSRTIIVSNKSIQTILLYF